ncbi:hypothetical protein PYCCODRAFT_1444915 [Trametes coccinea BRFM310]|uniref:Cytochrome b561 domain-containing protein n=1 Tax=Trametes coccinea (strain BRFM310) TaxID=1353009 RepID=A0A1Y2INZ3_TRAC3|nr:hypothetical protein PYCCODRAFT_1444915 [Trametes coccinea BRFM310]
MAGTPMVIMWRNADGSVTVSQREATGLVEPVPVVSPARRATLSRLSGPNSSAENSPILAFDIPSDGANATQSLIWAFGITIPSADPASNIEQHLDAGTFTLNLTKTLDNVPDSSSTQTRPDGRSTSASALLVAHAVVSAVGFLVLLPLSALIGRWARTFTPRWFSAHWFITVVLGIPAVCIGWALGPLAVTQEGKAHAVTAHQVCGVLLLALYLIEIALGTIAHMRRKSDAPHPPRNVAHILLGLTLFGLSIFEVRGNHPALWDRVRF